jgi:hypothetical protein
LLPIPVGPHSTPWGCPEQVVARSKRLHAIVASANLPQLNRNLSRNKAVTHSSPAQLCGLIVIQMN